MPQGTWRIGKIIKLVPSKDGETRAAKIQLPSKKILSRTLDMLYPLECTDYAEGQLTAQNTKLKETDPMEGIRESNNKAEQRPLRQADVKAKEKI